MNPDVRGVLIVEIIPQQRRPFGRQLALLKKARLLEIETYCRVT
jgi:hypothetical protein